ncbi:MAG: hypothetical protein V4584_05830 [Verrucomicrobiota bacterium]
MDKAPLVIILRTRLRPEVVPPKLAADLERLGGRMYELASEMPGFLSYKDFLLQSQMHQRKDLAQAGCGRLELKSKIISQ